MLLILAAVAGDIDISWGMQEGQFLKVVQGCQLFRCLHWHVTHCDGEPPQVRFVVLLHAEATGEAARPFHVDGATGEGPLSLHSGKSY